MKLNVLTFFSGILLGLFLLCASCKQSSFAGGSGSAPSPPSKKNAATNEQKTQATTGGSLNQSSTNGSVQTDPTQDQAIQRCLSRWKGHPFPAEKPVYRTIAAAINLGGETTVRDDHTTQEPELILIVAGVSILGKTKYEFLNPNGWYCFAVDVDIKSETSISLHCHARLADSLFDLSIDSTTNDAAGAVGVHVGSNITLTRVGQCF